MSEKTIVILVAIIGLTLLGVTAVVQYCSMRESEKAMDLGYEQVFEFGKGTIWKRGS
jgi:uncharacterized membrane protein